MPGGVTNVVLHVTRPDSSTADYSCTSISDAVQLGNDLTASHAIEAWYITYTDTHGNTVEYDQN